MAIIKSYSPFLNLSNFQVFENDELPNSTYFRITELNETLTGGKNGFLIEGSEHLKESTEIKIEILDVEGNPVYFEPSDGNPEYYEGNSKLVSVHVYDDTAIGIGKITILGELKTHVADLNQIKDIPKEWKGVYNVKWERTIQINKNISNETIVRFYKKPSVTIDELVKPIFTKNIPSVTQTGTLFGISQSPPSQSDITKWRAGTNYKLKISDGISNWTSSVDDNIISVPSLNYSANVIEVLSDTEVMVDTPYTSSGDLVNDFVASNYTTTFEYVEGQTITDSALTGSFAKINFSSLKTFVGDVARVKVFRKSRNTVGDYQFVQESKLESTELLKDITTTSDTELSYGMFDESNLSNYWITSSNDHPVTINSDKLNASVKTNHDASAGGTQILSTSGSFEITSGVEYTLNFKTLLSGSEGTSQSIRAYFSGSNYEQNFLSISGSSIYNTRQSVSQNILATTTANDTYLKFDIDGGDWYISNVSLKNAQDTSFSPDEFTLIQDIPRKLAIETFDFKFEFYDINNNYIPVDVTTTKAFNGGNDFPSSDKLLTFESDRNAFRFTSGSIGNPPFQQIQFKTRTNNLTGSATYASSAFDKNGAYIIPASYTGTYPGTLSNVTSAGAIIKIADFSGSDASITVGSIVYTASIEEQEEFETVYRLEDGDNAPQLIVTSNVNQFIYEPTTLSSKPTGQSATIRAQRKNLTSLTTPIEVNSGSGAPPLSAAVTDNATGIDTYTISALAYSASFAGNSFLETTYSFTGSDQFDLPFSDEITISPVINFDAVSIVLSNESTSFPANSLGVVTSNFDASKGTVQMFVGGTQITHDDIGGGRLKNTFDVTSIVESNVTAISTSPTTSEYGISAFGNSHDSGSLTLNIEYLAGDLATSQSFQKVVSYTKAKTGVPNVEVSVTPQSQTLNANSIGTGSASPATITVSALEGGVNRFTSIGSISYTGGLSGTISTNTVAFSDTVSDMESEISTLTIPINFTDSDGTTGTKNVVANITRVKSVPPVVTISANPQAQTVSSNADFSTVGTPSAVTINVNEGGSNYSYTTSTVTANKFKITGVTNGTNNNNGTITPATPTSGAGKIPVVTVSYTNSEGTAFTSKTITLNVGVAAQGSDGSSGAQGPSGLSGIAGLNFDVSPASQNITRTQTPVSYGTPSVFTVNVIQGSTTFSYDNSLPYSSGSFYIDSVVSGSNNSNKTITPTTPSSLTAVTTTFDINYTDISGSAGSISKSHITNVVVDGNTGPGVVHTGEWASGRNYLFSDDGGGTGRRDSVLYSGTYYAATAQHTSTNNTLAASGTPGSGPWQSLGTGDLFVAAKIAVFEDSFIQNTLNVGTNNNGGLSTANIALVGGTTTPYIAIGQASHGYSNTGIWLGNNTGSYSLSLTGASNHLQWNGSTLDIKGKLEITSGETFNQLNHISTETGSLQSGVIGATSSGSLGISNAATAQSTANTAQSTADSAQSTANTATGSAAAAQSAIDTMETQVVLDSGGMELRRTSGHKVAKYGTTTYFYDGTTSEVIKLQLQAAGITAFGDDANTYATVTSTGLNVIEDSVNVANFGSTMRIGVDASDKSALRVAADGSMSIGTSETSNINISAAGSVTITGAITIAAGSTSAVDFGAGAAASASAASTAASNAQGTADGAEANAQTGISNAATAQGTANTATGSAAAAQSTANTAASVANAVAAVTSSLVNPTSYAFGGSAFALATNTASTGLNLTSDFLGYHDGNGFKTYMDNSGNFYLGGTGGALTWTAATSTLNVNRVTATSGTIGSWAIASSQLEGGTVQGGSDGNNTTSGMIINSGGWISAPDFNISSSGVASFGTSAKIGNKPFSGLLEISDNKLQLKGNARWDGENLSTKFGSYDLTTTTANAVYTWADQADCVLPGTKIISKRGDINVEDTKEDDIIKIFNFETKEWGWSSIDKIHQGKSKRWIKIKTKTGKELKCSDSHALYHPDYVDSVLRVNDLKIGSELYILNNKELQLDIVSSIEIFDEEVMVWNYHLDKVHNYISDGILSHNFWAKPSPFTSGHQYVKVNNVSIEMGDLVKLDSNNQIIKTTSSKDTEVIGILWKTFPSGSSYEYQDSMGIELPENERDTKTIWKTASIGDSYESGSTSTLPGFKVCNQGGDVSRGDLLCSSDTVGYLMKQPSEYVVTSFDGDNNPQYEERQSQCSYTVAKSMEVVTFDDDGRAEGIYGYLYCG